MTKYIYNNKNVYIGLDVHKTTYAYTVRCEKVTVKKGTLPASPQGLVTFLKRYFPGANIHSAYEAGFCGFYLHRYLCNNGINNIVINPSSIESAAKERVKTDKKDSMKIAIQLEADRLKGIYVPSIQQERNREISRLRDDLIRKKRTISNQIKSLFHRYGIEFRSTTISKKWIEEHQNLEMPYEIDFVFRQYTTAWLQTHTRVREIEEELKKQAEADKKTQQIIESLPGIGFITARFITNELGDMSQFSNVRQLYSFTGLTPREYSSGEHIRLGHISRQGRSSIRKVLIQSAWVAVRYDKEIRLIFENLSKGIGKKKAIIAIARKLIGRVRACLKRGSSYVRYTVSEQGELIARHA